MHACMWICESSWDVHMKSSTQTTMMGISMPRKLPAMPLSLPVRTYVRAYVQVRKLLAKPFSSLSA